MSEESRFSAAADAAVSEPPREAGSPAAPDRGKTVVLCAMGGVFLLALGLIARGPKNLPPAPAAALEGTLTSAEVTSRPGALAADAGASSVPGTKTSTETERRFSPAWRVANLKSEAGLEVVEGTFGKQTLVAILGQSGISRVEGRRVAHAFDGVRPAERPTSKDAYAFAKDRAKGTVVAFEFSTSPSDVWQMRVDDTDPDKAPVAKKLELFVEHRRVGASVAVTGDLGKALTSAGLREEAKEKVDDALEGHIDAQTIRAGVRMRVVADEEWVEGTFARLRVDALEFIPKTGAPLRVYYYERDGDDARRHPNPKNHHTSYYDARGQQVYRGAFRSPLPLARVTSRFNPRRMHPVLHVVMPHNGVDFGASTGTPVYASAPGSIASVGDGGRCGNMVQIEHGNGLTTAYCHLSRFAQGLRAGQHVEARQLVGYVGQTGSATGPHLHFAVKRGGAFIDPMALKMDGVRVLPSADREAFAKRRAELDAALDVIAMPLAPDAPAVEEKDESGEPAGEE